MQNNSRLLCTAHTCRLCVPDAWVQVGVCHCLLPLLAIPLTFILIPNKLMTDNIHDINAADTEQGTVPVESVV
jgi:hypothetical protein